MGQGGRRAAQASGLLREARDARAWAGARETGPWDAGSERACCGVRLGRVGKRELVWATRKVGRGRGLDWAEVGLGFPNGLVWVSRFGFWVSFLFLIQTKTTN